MRLLSASSCWASAFTWACSWPPPSDGGHRSPAVLGQASCGNDRYLLPRCAVLLGRLGARLRLCRVLRHRLDALAFLCGHQRMAAMGRAACKVIYYL